MAKSTAREKIQLRSTGKKKDGKTETGYFKTSYKNKRNTEKKLSLKKFDPHAWNAKTQRYGMVVDFVEKKIAK